jgi:competence protein ComEC
MAGLVGLLASLYFQWRMPQPAPQDISQLIPAGGSGRVEVTLQAAVENLPRLTRNGGRQFWVTVQQVDELTGPSSKLDPKQVIGKLYVTAPPETAAALQPGQRIKIRGTLSRPQPATNPGGFDFQDYLRREGCFAALRSNQIKVVDAQVSPGLWQIQQRIVRSQALWTSPAEGALISAMVLGGRAVDLPFDVKDNFIRVGLAHALAASGFQTSLILGVVLALCYRWSERVQFAIGTTALLLFVGLAGAQPAVLRAAIMGFGGLVALVLGQKIRPLGSLLVTATLLLLINPLWIWDLGFQLSFLATLGLLVTVPSIAGALDWMPSAISPLFAVPIAAYAWTLPLCLYAFGIVSPYSIPANLVTTLLISVLSLGGMVSALGALVWPPLGSGSAWLLKFPAAWLIGIVDGFAQLPGNAWAVGTISAGMAIALYGLISLTWLQSWWQRRWWVALLIAVGLVSIPAWQTRLAQFQVTILATAGYPTLVVQEGGRTGLIQTQDTAVNTVLPFLQKAGVNQLDWVVPLEVGRRTVANAEGGKPKATITAAVNTMAAQPAINNWQKLSERLPIQMDYALPTRDQNFWLNAKVRPQGQTPLQPGQVTPIGAMNMQLLHQEPAIVAFNLKDQKWLWLEGSNLERQAQLSQTAHLSAVQVLWWSGQRLHPELLKVLQPRVAIASARTVNPDTAAQLRAAGTQLYWTGRDGALQWNPQTGFKTTLNSGENSAAGL